MHELAKDGKIDSTGVCHLALSKECKKGLKLVQQWMDDAGLQTKIDHFGNLIGRYFGWTRSCSNDARKQCCTRNAD